MGVDLKWADAMAVKSIGDRFTAEQKAQGWPLVMEPFQLAAMQRPYGNGDYSARNYAGALRKV